MKTKPFSSRVAPDHFVESLANFPLSSTLKELIAASASLSPIEKKKIVPDGSFAGFTIGIKVGVGPGFNVRVGNGVNDGVMVGCGFGLNGVLVTGDGAVGLGPSGGG